jgi:hypothetical protein
MKKVRLKESELVNLIKRMLIKEQHQPVLDDEKRKEKYRREEIAFIHERLDKIEDFLELTPSGRFIP